MGTCMRKSGLDTCGQNVNAGPDSVVFRQLLLQQVIGRILQPKIIPLDCAIVAQPIANLGRL